MSFTTTILVSLRDMRQLQAAVMYAGGRFLYNPTRLSKNSALFNTTLEFDNVHAYTKFLSEYERNRTNLVEVDKRKWYTKYLNRLILIFKFK